LAPQCEQNFSPANINPKHDGQATVASRAPQCSHRAASVEAAAPHIGQFSVSAGMISFHNSLFNIPDSPSAITFCVRICTFQNCRGQGI
jgi:hypothetical protein